ncbi:hypothetical protein ACOSQ2_002536 [Xanthoceras sorbifolium]
MQQQESKCAGSFYYVGGFNNALETSKVNLVMDLNIEKPIKKIKMNKKKKKKSASQLKKSRIILFLRWDKPKMEVGSSAMNSKKCLKNNILSVSTTSICAIHMNGCPEDPNIQSSNTGTLPKQSSHGCLIEVSYESISFGNLSQCKFCESTNIIFGNSEVSNSCHTAIESNRLKCNNSACQLAVNKSRHQLHNMAEKENIHQIWQKSQRSARKLQKHGPKRLHCKYVEKDVSLLQKNYLVKNNAFLSRELLPNPLITSSRHIDAANVKLNRNLDQCVSQPSQVSKYKDCQEKSNLIPTFKTRNNFKSKKGQKCQGENFLGLQDKYCFSRKENLPMLHELNYYENALHNSQNLLYQFMVGFNHTVGVKIPVMNSVVRRSFHSSTYSEPYMRFNQFNEHTLRKDVTSGMNAKKWVPVGIKESRMLEKTGSVNIYYVNNSELPLLCKGDDDNHTDANMIDHHASAGLRESKSTSSIACDERNSVQSEVLKSENVSKVQNVGRSEVREAYAQKSEDNQQHIIGSRMVTKTLSTASKRQLISENTELIIISYPLAEFERFLCAATPVIASSYAYKNCSVCLHDQLSSCFLCKHQIPNTSLCSVWKWYEEPGNYGLKVKTGDSQNLKGLLTESMSSYAYVVPYSISSPVCSSNCELVFQFLESEKSHLRKPLCNTIVDLIDAGTSNLQVFSDPSKLEYLKLCDLHPASWFSVDWYPIYRIPDRNFCASFLTYHSLGHLVKRHVPTDSLDKKSFPCGRNAKLQHTGEVSAFFNL